MTNCRRGLELRSSIQYVEKYSVPGYTCNSYSCVQVDSDALSERLKAAYPDCKTHRERKHRAAIEFLNAELSWMQSGSPIADHVSPNNVQYPSQEPTPSITRLQTHAVSEGSEILSPPACTPSSFIESTLSPRLADRIRPAPQATADLEQPQVISSPTTAQQFVWSAHDGRSLQPKTKRKMTVEERNVYRNTRKRGACDKCRRQKGRVVLSRLQNLNKDAC